MQCKANRCIAQRRAILRCSHVCADAADASDHRPTFRAVQSDDHRVGHRVPYAYFGQTDQSRRVRPSYRPQWLLSAALLWVSAPLALWLTACGLKSS